MHMKKLVSNLPLDHRKLGVLQIQRTSHLNVRAADAAGGSSGIGLG